MNHPQKLGRTPGSADVPLVVVTRRRVVPAGPDCAACNENCAADADGFSSRRSAPQIDCGAIVLTNGRRVVTPDAA
jgi:hypothetical protein